MASVREASPDLAASLHDLLAGQRPGRARRFLESGPDLPELPIPVSGQTIGAYTLERPLVRAAWARVAGPPQRRALRRPGGDQAAESGVARPAGQERFRREGSVLARLSHPNIARLLDAGVSASGQPYLVLEYVDGQPIDVFADARRLGVEDRVRLILDVLDAVGHAHAHLIVHRDLKPSNILVSADGTVKLLDFGIATLLAPDGGEPLEALTRDGRALTPISPRRNRFVADPISVGDRCLSLGVLLYLLVCGRRPYSSRGGRLRKSSASSARTRRRGRPRRSA